MFSIVQPQATGIIQALQQQITMNLLPTATCNAAGIHNGLVLESMVCANSVAQASGACPVILNKTKVNFACLIFFFHFKGKRGQRTLL